jgi:hypothetical protein
MRFDARQIDHLCEAYLHAVDHLQFGQLTRLWELASRDNALELAFHELNEALLDDEKEKDFARSNRLRPT